MKYGKSIIPSVSMTTRHVDRLGALKSLKIISNIAIWVIFNLEFWKSVHFFCKWCKTTNHNSFMLYLDWNFINTFVPLKENVKVALWSTARLFKYFIALTSILLCGKLINCFPWPPPLSIEPIATFLHIQAAVSFAFSKIFLIFHSPQYLSPFMFISDSLLWVYTV